MPEIRSMPPTPEYRENWERVFGVVCSREDDERRNNHLTTFLQSLYSNGCPVLEEERTDAIQE